MLIYTTYLFSFKQQFVPEGQSFGKLALMDQDIEKNNVSLIGN
tara:strand:- start:888 stop:1016 length:129 start_codon:yes stop_codon:yes gene_type:complete